MIVYNKYLIYILFIVLFQDELSLTKDQVVCKYVAVTVISSTREITSLVLTKSQIAHTVTSFRTESSTSFTFIIHKIVKLHIFCENPTHNITKKLYVIWNYCLDFRTEKSILWCIFMNNLIEWINLIYNRLTVTNFSMTQLQI